MTIGSSQDLAKAGGLNQREAMMLADAEGMPFVGRATPSAPRTWGVRVTLPVGTNPSASKTIELPWPALIVGVHPFVIPVSDGDFGGGAFCQPEALEALLEFDRDRIVTGQVTDAADGGESNYCNLSSWDSQLRTVNLCLPAANPRIACTFRSIRALAGDVIVGLDFFVRRYTQRNER